MTIDQSTPQSLGPTTYLSEKQLVDQTVTRSKALDSRLPGVGVAAWMGWDGPARSVAELVWITDGFKVERNRTAGWQAGRLAARERRGDTTIEWRRGGWGMPALQTIADGERVDQTRRGVLGERIYVRTYKRRRETA